MTVNLREALAAAGRPMFIESWALILPAPPPGHCWKIEGHTATSVPADCHRCAGRDRIISETRAAEPASDSRREPA